MPSSATNRNRKARQQAKSDTEALLAAAAAGTLATTSGAGAGAAGAGAAGGFAQQLAAAGAESAKTAAAITALIAALAVARGGVEWLVDVLRPEFPPEDVSDADIAEAAELERQREADFIEAMRFRLNRDLPEALKQADPDAAVAALLEREQRYMEQHDDATAARVQALLKRRVVKQVSPEGAYWVLSPAVAEHTPDCVALASVGWWPWSVLDRIHPPVHTGCQCDLLTRDQAIGFGYMEADEPLMGDDEARLRIEAITRQFDLGEGWRTELPIEGESPHELMELRWNRRYKAGTIWGGRFMPRRGGFAPRISIREIIRKLDGPDIDVVGRGSERTVAAPDPNEVTMRSPRAIGARSRLGERVDAVSPDLPDRQEQQPSALAGPAAFGRTQDFVKAIADRRGGSFPPIAFYTKGRDREGIPSAGGGRRPGEVLIGEKEQEALRVVSEKLARGERPTVKEAMAYWDARRLITHETIHNASAIPPAEYLNPDGYGLEEALTEELAHILAAEQLREEGATDVLRAVAENPDHRYALGVYRPQREGLLTVFEYGKVPEGERRDLIERLAMEVDSTEERIKILAGYVAEAQGVEEQRAIDIVRGALFDYGRDPNIYPGQPGATVVRPDLDTIDPSLGFAYGDEVTVNSPDGETYTGRVIGSGTYDGEGELTVEVDGPDGRRWRHPLVSQVEGAPEPERDAGGMVRPDPEPDAPDAPDTDTPDAPEATTPAPEAPDTDMPQGEVPALTSQTDALMRGDAAGGPTLRPEEREMLEMASPALLDSLDDGEGPVETALRQTLNEIGVDPYDFDIAELEQHAATHEGAPKSRFTIAGRGASVCANSRSADFAIHLLLPEMLREKYPDLAEQLRATSPRWGRKQDRQMPLGLSDPDAPQDAPSAPEGDTDAPEATDGVADDLSPVMRAALEMASPGAESPEAEQAAIDVGSDVNRAADLLAAGYRVKLDQPRSVSILLDELRDRVAKAREQGEDAPNFDLCDIYIPNTNLFCAESKGIRRNEMPQLAGVPIEGSPASELEPLDTGGVGEEGIVDIMPQFRERLAEMGVETTEEEVPASHLRASQTELNGGKVAGIAGFIEGGGQLEGAIIVSSDDYVVDGHHRWAANVGVDTGDGELGDVNLPVIRVNMPITELLELANGFAREMGIPQADVEEDKAAARRELASRGELPEGDAPEMASPVAPAPVPPLDRPIPRFDDQAVETFTDQVRSGRISRMGSPLLISGIASERAAEDGKDYEALPTEEKRAYVEQAKDEIWKVAISLEPDSELRDLVDNNPRLASLAQAELDSRAGGEMASPGETKAERQAAKDTALDAVAEMASPNYEPDEAEVEAALRLWIQNPQAVRTAGSNDFARAIASAVQTSDPGPGPFFRGQEPDDPEPTGLRGWSRDFREAIGRGFDEGGATGRVVTIYVAEQAEAGLDINSVLGDGHRYASEQEVILNGDGLAFRRLDIEVPGNLDIWDPLSGEERLNAVIEDALRAEGLLPEAEMASPAEVGGTPFRPEDADDPEGFQRKLADYQRRFAETAEALGVEEMANREQQGVWDGEPEPSVATDLGDVDAEVALAAAAIVGRFYNQDAMAVFVADDDAPGGRFAVRIPEGLEDQELLERITEGMPRGEGASILDGVAYFYAHDYDEGAAAADSLAEALDSDWQAERGTFTLVSDEDYGDTTYEQAVGGAVGQARDLTSRWESEDRGGDQALDTGGSEGAGPETTPAGDPGDPRGDDPGAVASEPVMASPATATPSRISELSEAEAAELIVSDDFFGLSFDEKLELVDILGVDTFPKPGPVGQRLLGGAKDTQQRYKVGKSYTPERNQLHSELKGRLIAGYVPEDSEKEGKPVYRGGLAGLLGLDHPITQKVINEGIDALTEEDREFIREAAALARGGQPPQALFMAGGAAVGKSSALKADPDLKPDSAVTVNSDDLKVMLPEYDAQVEAGEKGAAPSVHEESSDLAKSLNTTVMELGLNIVVDGTGNNDTITFERKLREMSGAGYTVDVVVVNLPTEEAMTRAVRRAVESGRYVPTDTLRKAHSKVSANIQRLATADFIRTLVMFDNEVPFGEPPIKFAEVNEGEITVLEQDLLDRFYAKADEVTEREAYDRTVGIEEAAMSDDESDKGTMPENPVPPDRWTYWVPGDWVDFLNREPIEIVTTDGRLLDEGGRFIRDLTDEEMEQRSKTEFDEEEGDQPEIESEE